MLLAKTLLINVTRANKLNYCNICLCPNTTTHMYTPIHVDMHACTCAHTLRMRLHTHTHTHTTKYDSPSEYPEFCYTFRATAIDYHR